MIKKILDYVLLILNAILKVIKKEEVKPDEIVEIEEDVVESDPIEEVEEPVVVEEYKKATINQYQKMLKALGLYTLEIDGKVGNGTKKAIKQFNIIFLNKKSEEYEISTDRLLKKIYNSYYVSKYMTSDLWQYFKNFKKTEYRCPKWCNGYPSEIAIKLVMADQYLRNVYGKSVNISSGLRCQKHNDELKGSSKNSNHLKGRASDCSISGITAKKLMATVKELPFVSYTYCIDNNYIHKTVNL